MLIMIMMMIIITVMFFIDMISFGHHSFRGMGDNPEENGSPKACSWRRLVASVVIFLIFVEGRINVLQQIYSSELL